MKGKHYFFLVAKIKSIDIDISQTEFDDYIWASFSKAQELVNKIYQKGKKRVTNEIINKLKLVNFIQ